ncbi:hypothetical protein ACWDGI_10010 [Streptomyces sp. NPDC001220]
MTRSRIRSTLAWPVAGLLLTTGWLAGCGDRTSTGDAHSTRQPAPDEDMGMMAVLDIVAPRETSPGK